MVFNFRTLTEKSITSKKQSEWLGRSLWKLAASSVGTGTSCAIKCEVCLARQRLSVRKTSFDIILKLQSTSIALHVLHFLLIAIWLAIETFLATKIDTNKYFWLLVANRFQFIRLRWSLIDFHWGWLKDHFECMQISRARRSSGACYRLYFHSEAFLGKRRKAGEN